MKIKRLIHGYAVLFVCGFLGAVIGWLASESGFGMNTWQFWLAAAPLSAISGWLISSVVIR